MRRGRVAAGGRVRPGFGGIAGGGRPIRVDLSVMSDMTGDIRDGGTSDEGGPRTDAWQTGIASQAAFVTAAGAEWLVSASPFPRSVRALWTARPEGPGVLPCGTAFDVVDLPALFGRRVLDRLWTAGPGCGPVAAHRGRIWLFALPGTADRLPALLSWEEWGHRVPPMICHGAGDAVTVPPLVPAGCAAGGRPAGVRTGSAGGPPGAGGAPRWVVAPDVRDPWLPGAAVLLWAVLRVVRAERRARDGGGIDFSSAGSGC